MGAGSLRWEGAKKKPIVKIEIYTFSVIILVATVGNVLIRFGYVWQITLPLSLIKSQLFFFFITKQLSSFFSYKKFKSSLYLITPVNSFRNMIQQHLTYRLGNSGLWVGFVSTWSTWLYNWVHHEPDLIINWVELLNPNTTLLANELPEHDPSNSWFLWRRRTDQLKKARSFVRWSETPKSFEPMLACSWDEPLALWSDHVTILWQHLQQSAPRSTTTLLRSRPQVHGRRGNKQDSTWLRHCQEQERIEVKIASATGEVLTRGLLWQWVRAACGTWTHEELEDYFAKVIPSPKLVVPI